MRETPMERGYGPPQTAPIPREACLNQPGMARRKGGRTYFTAQLSKHWNMPVLIKSPQYAESPRSSTAAGTEGRQNSCKFYHHSSNAIYVHMWGENRSGNVSHPDNTKRASIFVNMGFNPSFCLVHLLGEWK